MFNREEIFEICLEDYTQPRCKSAVRSYYGTQDEITALVERLKNIDGANIRYKSTINAVEFYDLDNELTHTIAGQTMPVLKSVQEICHCDTQLNDLYWDYHTYEGSVIRCYASQIDVRQSLFDTGSGYDRCVKASFTGLCVYRHGVGWVSPGNNFNGFPGMVTYDGCCATMTLFASQEHYDLDDLDAALFDVVDVSRVRPSVAAADILGEG